MNKRTPSEQWLYGGRGNAVPAKNSRRGADGGVDDDKEQNTPWRPSYDLRVHRRAQPGAWNGLSQLTYLERSYSAGGFNRSATRAHPSRDISSIKALFPTIPPRVDYELTKLGRKLIVPLKALSKWARENRPAMLAAREAFQRRGQHGSPRTRFTVPK